MMDSATGQYVNVLVYIYFRGAYIVIRCLIFSTTYPPLSTYCTTALQIIHLTLMFLLSKNSRTSSVVQSYERFPRQAVYGGFVGRRLGSTLGAEANIGTNCKYKGQPLSSNCSVGNEHLFDCGTSVLIYLAMQPPHDLHLVCLLLNILLLKLYI